MCGTLQAQVTQASKIWLTGFSTPVLHKSRVRKLNVHLGSIEFFSFRLVRFCLIVELNQTQSMN